MSVTQVIRSVGIPGYRILRSLGEGGMASVYLAMQESLDREVALKVMSSTLAANAEFTDRFLKEGRLTAKLSHPNIVTVYDIGQHQDTYYLTQEYIPGGTLRERMDKRLTVPEILDVARDVALGLAYAHEKGVVHRDVKPGNVLFRANGTAVLADFGIAKAMNSNTMATLAGNSIGTPHYMSPEQARAEKVDGRSDLYSLGAMIVEMLTDAPPYDSSDPYTIALMHVTHPLPKLPAEHAWLQPLINQLMAKLPDARFANGDAFVAACDKLIAAAPEARALRDAHATRKRSAPRAVVAATPIDHAAPTQRGLAVNDMADGVAPATSRKPWIWGVAGAAALLLAFGLGGFINRRVDGGDGSMTPSEPDKPVVQANDPVSVDDTTAVDQPTPVVIEGDVGSLLAKANGYVAVGLLQNGRRLSSPIGDNAIEIYQQVLRMDAGNAEAKQGLARIADYYESKAVSLLDRGVITGCYSLAVIGQSADPDRASLIKLRDVTCAPQ